MTGHNDPTRLVLVIHNHQPVGNFDFVFEQATDSAYAPLVDLLAEHPRIRVGLHFTGPLLEWLETHRSEVVSVVREMCARGQVEVLGGGWAEPMLAVLTDADAQGQIRMMRAECARLFGVLPRGMWLAERVWDPDLPRLLRAASVEHTLLDDTHFRFAGCLEPRLTGHYVTEKAGDAVAVFPIDRKLRYAIPFSEAEAAVEAIRSVGPGRTVTYGDDGEKFGVWPETHEWVWDKGWLKRFFELLEDPAQGIDLVLPSEQVDRYPATGRVYLPTASYHEMGEWTLAPDAGRQLLDLKKQLAGLGLADRAEPFLHGGIWMGFLAKYPEANVLHKRMLRASAKVARAARQTAGVDAVVERARRALYRGQCNCPYWHGLFGGLYLPHLRHAVYRQLALAEALADPIAGARVEVRDLDGDLRDEVALESRGISLWIDPSCGGQVTVLDDRARSVSLAHVLTRRAETYHRDLLQHAAGGAAETEAPKSIHDIRKSKVADLEQRLVYDPYLRRVLVDHLLPAGAGPEAIRGPGYQPLADLVRAVHEVRETGQDGDRAWVELCADADLVAGPGGRVHLVKRLRLDAPATLSVEYELTWDAPPGVVETFEAMFGVESAFALVPGPEQVFHVTLVEPATGGEAGARRSPQEPGSWPTARRIAAGSSLGEASVTVTLDPPASASWFPIDTVSQSEDGAELVYQGTCLLCAWPVALAPGETVRRSLVLQLE